MNPKCGKCTKTVYPTEELKCLDKVWHKACFKCTVCNMTLNMKNYKGYNKMPYCNAHYPTTKHTVVADTPENRRIAENTKIQSAVKYHAEFERQKGSKTSVAEDPEIARIRQNTANQSNVSYWGVREQRNIMESKRPNEQVDEVVSRRQPGKISDYDPAVDQPSPYSQRSSANVVYDSQKGGIVQGHRVQPGSIADYDPMNERHSSIVNPNQHQGGGYHQQPQQPQPPKSQPPPQPEYQPPPPKSQPPPQPEYQPPPPQQMPPPQPKQPAQIRYRAMYDYTAADDDEVSFVEGDLITNCEIIDEGWMTGVVMRSGQHGMLPSNYVQKE